MKRRLADAAKNEGISQMGVVKAEVFSDLGDILQKHPDVPMTPKNTDERINPFLIMENVKSIIVYLFPYFSDNMPHNISKYAHGLDYHAVIQKKLSPSAALLRENGFSAVILADNSALNDRYLAFRAGLGFIGKNGFLINPVYGTYTFIGYILTDCPIEADTPMNISCNGCMKCIKACPGGALSDNHMFDADKCLSYITQKKGELTPSEQSLIHLSGCAWGCDICQDVCPHNIGISPTEFEEFSQNLIHTLKLDENLSNREFKKIYADRAFSWRGKKVIERNLKIIGK